MYYCSTGKTMHSAMIIADPYKELPLKTAKQASLCEELHLASRNITSLGNDFQFFINLECLWLNDNKLMDIDGLEGNFRLKTLYLHGNKIRKIYPETFESFIALNSLTLSNNVLDDLDGCIASLKRIRNLTSLELFDNFIAKEDNYKLRIIGELPGLITFDRHLITPEERQEARQLLIKLTKLKNFKIVQKTTLRKPTLTAQQISDNNKLEDIKITIRNYLASTRTMLDASFTIHDRRKLGYVDESRFWEVLRQYGVVNILNEDEIRIISDKYTKQVEVDSISKTGVIPQTLLDYRSFCFDVSPKELCKLVPYKYKMELVPEISQSTQHLNSYVKTINSRRLAEETLMKKQTMLAASANGFGKQSSTSTAKTAGNAPQVVVAGDLDAWTTAVLSKILKANQTGREMTVDQFTLSMQMMSKYNKTLTISLQEAVQSIFEGKEKVSVYRVAQALGCTVVIKDSVTPAAAAASNGMSLISTATKGKPAPTTNTVNPESSPRPCRLYWRELTIDEANTLESKLFTQSETLFDTLLRSGAKDDVTALTASLTALSIDATRLASQRKIPPSPPRHLLPGEVFAKASKRADLVVLPNLLPYQLSSEAINVDNKNGMTFKNKTTVHGTSASLSSSLNNLNSTRTPFTLSGKFKIPHKLDGSSGQVPPSNLTYSKGWNEGTATITID